MFILFLRLGYARLKEFYPNITVLLESSPVSVKQVCHIFYKGNTNIVEINNNNNIKNK